MRARIFALAAVALLAACGSSPTTTPPAGSAKVSPPPSSELFTAGKLTIGSDVSYPPQEFFPVGSQTPDGFDIDIGKALATAMGLDFAVVNTPFDGIIPALNSKKFDIMVSAMTITDTRKTAVDFIPYFVAGESFVVAKNSTLTLTKLSDLCGHKVAAESGTAELDEANGLNKAGAPCANNKVKVTTFQKDTEALVELKKGNVEIHFTDSPVGAYEVLQDSSNLKLSGGIIEVAPEGIALRKNDPALESPVTAAFNQIKTDGTYASILAKWNVSDGDISKAP
ncbi:MAG TPA: ABC transporter substrate-binding protein [Candidatus Dormibacteraeota bacterium]